MNRVKLADVPLGQLVVPVTGWGAGQPWSVRGPSEHSPGWVVLVHPEHVDNPNRGTAFHGDTPVMVSA